MIGRRITPSYPMPVLPRVLWAAVLIAHEHKLRAAAAGKNWECDCRCCQAACEFVAQQLLAEKTKGASA
jgi:hypothetical protein